MNDLLKDLSQVARFTPMEPYQRFAYACASLLVLSAAVHGGVYLVDGGPWGGPVSWRKPILFGFSFGVTLATLTWFLTLLRLRRSIARIVLAVLALASVGEVFLVSMQKWRGVASHFNQDTSFDSFVFALMGFLAVLVALVTVLIVVRSLFRFDAPSSLSWAIRCGLVLMLVSLAVGAHMIIEGGNTFGTAGAMKMPHAFTAHAVQVLPALALLLLLSDLPEHRRIRTVTIGAIGYVGLIASTLLQAYGGRGPLDLGIASSATAVVGLGLLVTSAVIALRGIVVRLRLHRVGSR